MAKQKIYKNMSYEELEEALIEKMHLYRSIQVAHEKSGFHMSFLLTRQGVAQIVDRILSHMQEDIPGSLEQLAREQRTLETEFYKQVSSTTNKNILLEKKLTQSIREAVDAKLDEFGLPVVKPENYA